MNLGATNEWKSSQVKNTTLATISLTHDVNKYWASQFWIKKAKDIEEQKHFLQSVLFSKEEKLVLS